MSEFVKEVSGAFRIQERLSLGRVGRFRVARNALIGYVAFVEMDGQVDLSAPIAESATFPMSISITPPISGTSEIHVLLRMRDRYGLLSQNQKEKLITINELGEEELGSLSPVEFASISPTDNECFLISATYRGYNTDKNPADTWKVFIKADSEPDVEVDEPYAEGGISSETLSYVSNPFLEGGKTYYLSVLVERSEDNMMSEVSKTSIELPDDPLTPISVSNGYEG